jgi:FlaA1/EpsC-like NDP-sugar epimerase
MIHLSGFDLLDENSPMGDIEIVYTGLRPGEKLYEELLIGDNPSKTEHEKIMRAEEEIIDWTQLNQMIQQLEKAAQNNDYSKIRDTLGAAVSGYQPQCSIMDEVTLALATESQAPARASNVIQL